MKMTADVDEIPTMPSKAINGSFSVIALTLCSKRRYIISSARNLPKIIVLCIGYRSGNLLLHFPSTVYNNRCTAVITWPVQVPPPLGR